MKTWQCTLFGFYRLSLGGKPSPVIEGLTGEQRLVHRLRAEMARQDVR